MCERFGIEDYEQWFEDCPERVFDNWIAAYRLKPFGDEQLLLARLCSLVYLSVHKEYGDKTWEIMQKLTSCFMPGGWSEKTKDEQRQDFSTFEAQIAARYG